MPESSRLEKLIQKEEEIKDAIRREKSKLAAEKKKRETRRKILVGAIILEEAKTDEALQRRLDGLLKEKLTRPDDRNLFDLAPLAQNPANEH